MLSRDELTARVRAVIVEHLFETTATTQAQAEADVAHATTLSDLELDSLDTIEICMGLEEAFDLEIPDDEVERFKTVEDVVAHLAGRLGVAEVAA